jgi:DNA-binding FrmR family transcriptional regulator
MKKGKQILRSKIDEGGNKMKHEEMKHICYTEEPSGAEHKHPKHEEVLKLVRTAEGHLAGIRKMIEDDRYCIDISKQMLALMSILRRANLEILKKHMETCVKSAAGGENFDEKIKELETIMEYLTKGKGE